MVFEVPLNKLRVLTRVFVLLTLVTTLLVPLITTSRYILSLLVLILVFIIYTSAWNILAYSGQASLGHATFFGVGAYTSVLLVKAMGLPPLITTFIGGIFATFIGLLIGLTCVKLREWFLGMVTFGFAIIAQVICADPLSWLTGGWFGTFGPRMVSIRIPNYFIYEYYIVAAITIFTVFVMYLLMKSDIGLAFLAIKENELVAKSLGINVVKYKLLAFLISTFFAGVAGSLEVHTAMGGYVSPEIYGIDYSFKPLMYCIAGGLGTIEGPIIGTIAMTALWEWLRFLGTYERFMFIGILLVLIVIFLPKGITSAIRKLASRLFREKASTQAPR